jgi:ATPase family associated with various cellular activities (AAA)
MPINPDEFGASFQGFLDQMRTHTKKKPEEESFFERKLREHFGTDPSLLPVVSQLLPKMNQPSLHLAMEEYISQENRSAAVLGVAGKFGFREGGLADLVSPSVHGNSVRQGPVEYANIELDGERFMACIQEGLYLIAKGEARLAVYIRPEKEFGSWKSLVVEVMAPERAIAERFLFELRESTRVRSVYRGHVISLTAEYPDFSVKFHKLPEIGREEIVLPDGLLERIERHTIDFSRHSQRLLMAGRHLKRGLLLHGMPGTGKTLTIMYLARVMGDRTTFLVTGKGLGLIGHTCAMARMLQPSTVVIEDVDLVAEERTKGGAGSATPLLFELLNEMDGLAHDVDILFLLTTNRPDLLEPALAARPGRVDQAIEIPMPDASCRQRLFQLYGRGMKLEVSELPRFIARTEGASAAFIRELLRRAALFAAGDGEEIVVRDRHLDAALHDLVVQGGELTKSLLGFQSRIGFGARDRNATASAS